MVLILVSFERTGNFFRLLYEIFKYSKSFKSDKSGIVSIFNLLKVKLLSFVKDLNIRFESSGFDEFSGRDGRSFSPVVTQLPITQCGYLSDGVSLLNRPPQQKQPLDLYFRIDAPPGGPSSAVTVLYRRSQARNVSRGIPVSLATALIG